MDRRHMSFRSDPFLQLKRRKDKLYVPCALFQEELDR